MTPAQRMTPLHQAKRHKVRRYSPPSLLAGLSLHVNQRLELPTYFSQLGLLFQDNMPHLTLPFGQTLICTRNVRMSVSLSMMSVSTFMRSSSPLQQWHA